MDVYWWVFRFSISDPVQISDFTLHHATCHSKGLNPRQTAFAVHKYKSHHYVGPPKEIIAFMES